MTNRLFHPRPSWLLPENERLVTPASSYWAWHPSPTETWTASKTLHFLLDCFRVLYNMGMSNKQVAEVTCLMFLYSNQGKHPAPFLNLARLPITEDEARNWTGAGPFWYRQKNGQVFWAFDTLEDFLRHWVGVRLSQLTPAGMKFWQGVDWLDGFVSDPTSLKNTSEKIRVLFAQHVLKVVPITGTWNPASKMACKAFQELHPRSMMPWRQGELDGFTYKALVRRWRAQGMF